MSKITIIFTALFFAACASSGNNWKRDIASETAVPSGLHVGGASETIPAIALLREAKKSIDIEIYEMEDEEFLEAVREANNNGVKVRIIKDPYPVPRKNECLWFPGLKNNTDWSGAAQIKIENNDNAEPECREMVMPMIAEIRAKGGAVEPFYKPQLCGQDGQKAEPNGCFEHGKLILIDGETALVSTGNFNSSNLCNLKNNPSKCNRDYSYVTRDAAQVNKLREVFESDLTKTRYSMAGIAAFGSNNVPSVTVSPYSLDPLVAFIRTRGMGPGHRIQVQNQYLKEKNLNAALVDAAKSGAKVEIMVSSLCSFGKPDERNKEREAGIWRGFTDHGADMRYFTAQQTIGGKKGYMHAKAIVIDGKYAWIGSVNGSHSALNVNREFGVFFEDEESVARLSKQMSDDFTHEKSASWQQSWACEFDR